MGSEFPLFSATRLEVIKIDPEGMVPSRKICEMLPSLSPSIFYHHILPLSRLRKKSEIPLWNLWHLGYGENIFFAFPFKPDLLKCIIYSLLEGGRKYTKIGLAMGVTIGGDAHKSGKNTHLLVVMRVRLSQKIGLLDLTNHNRFKKGNGYKIRTKNVGGYWGMRLMLVHMRSISFWHTNVDLLGVCLHHPHPHKHPGTRFV